MGSLPDWTVWVPMLRKGWIHKLELTNLTWCQSVRQKELASFCPRGAWQQVLWPEILWHLERLWYDINLIVDTLCNALCQMALPGQDSAKHPIKGFGLSSHITSFDSVSFFHIVWYWFGGEIVTKFRFFFSNIPMDKEISNKTAFPPTTSPYLVLAGCGFIPRHSIWSEFWRTCWWLGLNGGLADKTLETI